MNKINLALIFFVFFLVGCHDNTEQFAKKPEKPAFDLARVQQQYDSIALEIVDISEQSFENRSALAITFSTPLNPEKPFHSFLKISDKNGQVVKGDWILSANGLVAYFPDIEPSSQYIVDVYKGLTSATAQQLKQTINKTVVTRKMPARVSFASQGSVLPAKLATGLPVISVNIDEVDVDFRRIKADKMSHFISTWYSHYNRQQQSYYELQEYAPLSELVYSGRFSLNPPKNSRHTVHLDIKSINALKQPGIYLAVMKPAGSYNYQQQVTFFTVSDLGMHARMYADKLLLQISSLTNGKAISGASLTLLDGNEKILDETISDHQGQALFIAPSNKAQLILARYKNNIALLRTNSPALDLTEFDIAGRPYKAIEIFTYGPRNLYRPGETVKINALLRDADGQHMISPPLKAIIKRPDGQKIKYFTLSPDSQAKNQGFYHTEYTLPKNAMTGQWMLELETTKNNKQQYTFQVEAFLPERMELLLGKQAMQENWTNATDTLLIPVSGQYLYGAPAASNRLSTKVIIKPNRHPINSLKDYYFGLEDEKPAVKYFELDDIKLDKKGLATVKVPSRWKNINNTPFTIKVINSLFETGGRPVTRSIDYHLWPQQTLIGIRPQLPLSEIPADASIAFELIKANVKGKLQGGTEVLISLIKERRDYYWEYSDARGWRQQYSTKNYKTFEQRLTLNKKQPISVKVPVDWGYFLLTVKDLQSGQLSSLRFYAGSGWRNAANNSAARPDRVVLKPNKKQYLTGETAQIKIIPPYAGNGFVLVENSEQPVWFQRLSIPAEGMNISIPIADNWNRHDLYISAIVFKPGDAREKITPNRAVGIIPLRLNRKKRHLSVTIDTPTTAIRPEKTFSTHVKIAGVNEQKATYVTLAAVDVGVLNITDYETPDPFQWFFQQRRYAVEQRDIYHKIIELTEGGTVKPRFGGDADKHAGGARPDSSVKIISLFSGLVKTDSQGIATINLDIPDFNGRLRLMAVAFNDNQFGAAEAEITVAAPIIAELSLPRFLAAGDNSTITLDIRNQSSQLQNLSIKLSADSPIQLQQKIIPLTLKNKQKKVFHFPITAEQAFGASKIELSLSNTNKSIDIRRHWQLGVRPAYPAIKTNQRQRIDAGKNFTINPALKNWLVSSARADLILSSQPPINIAQHLNSLLHYPYGCLEQTISSTYPWLFLTQENLKTLGLSQLKINNKAVDLKTQSIQIEKGISRLAGMQKSIGGFGLWSNKDNEEHWLTVYAADFLLDAREKGFNVPDELLNKTLIRLSQYLNHRGSMYGERYSQSPGHYTMAYKAYAAYVLSRVNRAPLGTLRTLFDHHRQQLKSALPLTHLGLALYQQGDKTRGLQAIKESLTKPRNKLINLADYGSRLRDLSVMTNLLTQLPIAVPESKTLVFQLGDELNNRNYLSTQERNALFQVGLALKSKPKSEWQGLLKLDKASLALKQQQEYQLLFKASGIPKNIYFANTTDSKLPVYLQFAVSAYPKTAPKLQMEKVKIERNYYDLQGNHIDIARHKTGDVILVHLNIQAKLRIQDALLLDLLPSGYELINQNLSHDLKIDGFKIGGKTIAEMQYYNRIKHQEYLDDRYIAALDLQQNSTEHLFYLMRAVTPGQYTNPPSYLEDMYRPYIRAIGRGGDKLEIIAQ